MTAAATAVVPTLIERPAKPATKSRRSRKAAEKEAQGGSQMLFFLGEKKDGGLLLTERFDTEGLAMIESLKRDAPFYCVEVWKSRAVVKDDGAVEIKKEKEREKFSPP